ncbi:MAG: hypothetical protein OEZ15_07495 [Gammaproteobacteria bacterium]|nr:hypothetical protein [Gammaproteobacteria bacterium]
MPLVKRIANFTDLAFIYSCILNGARKGHYLVDVDNPEMVRQMKKEIQSVITQQLLLDKRHAVASVYTLHGTRVAALIMSAASLDNNGDEIYAISVAREHQNRGFGSAIIDDVICSYQVTDIYARCSSASTKMSQLLKKRGFSVVATHSGFEILARNHLEPGNYAQPIYLGF